MPLAGRNGRRSSGLARPSWRPDAIAPRDARAVPRGPHRGRSGRVRARPVAAAPSPRRPRDVPRSGPARQPRHHPRRAGTPAPVRSRSSCSPTGLHVGCVAGSPRYARAGKRATTSRRRASSSSTTTSSRSMSSGRGAGRRSSRRGTRPGRSRSSATACWTSRSGRTRRWSIASPSTATTTSAWSRRRRSRRIYAEAFRQPLERFVSRLGIPRTDVLFGEERIARVTADIRRRYAIPDGRRVILYAPTFRGDNVIDARFSDDLDLGRLRDVLGDDHVVLVRLHPFIRTRAPIGPELAGFAIDVSDHQDINELLLVSDLLITDYSSVIFEYSLLGRPMVFFAPDHEAYERERGFYFDYRLGRARAGLRRRPTTLARCIRDGRVRPRPRRGVPARLLRRRRRQGHRALRRGDRGPGAASTAVTAERNLVRWHPGDGAVRYAPRASPASAGRPRHRTLHVR